ncbi:MAG: ABC-2 type transport system permease protein [Planctomycetota bacterium]|jgi:ABC-2 type transport system permease protein
MNHTITIFKRELAGYFATPVGYVFIFVFLFLAGLFTFNLGRLFEGGEATLRAFFVYLPWLFLFLVPAISMRLWAEERRQGTIELLMTLPISMTQAVLGKFLAAWAFAVIALLLTFPFWITVSFLGDPDHGVIIASYAGGALLAGGFLAIGSCISALTKNQVVAFVLSVVVCFLFMLTSFPTVLDMLSGWMNAVLLDAVRSFSFSAHFDSITKGVIDVRDIIFFASLITFFLFTNTLILDVKKAN